MLDTQMAQETERETKALLELKNIRLNPDTTMLNTSAMVTVLFGKYVESAQSSPFRLRMPRLWDMAGATYEIIQTGSASPARRGRSDHALTLKSAQEVFQYCEDNGLLVPARLLAATRTRNPMPLDNQMGLKVRELEAEVADLRARLAAESADK